MGRPGTQVIDFSLEGDTLLAAVAELYYKDGLTQDAIAKRLGLSRATIVNYLRQGREKGIVDIQIKGSAYTGSELSQELREKYGLSDVYITNTELKETPEQAVRSVARLGAMALSGLLRPGDVIGIAWGRTVQVVAEEMPLSRVENLRICQVMGSMNTPEKETSEASTIRIAERTGATFSTLHAPAILSTADLARQLRAEPIVQAQLQRLKTLTKLLYSVGEVDENTLVVTSGVAGEAELAEFLSKDAKAVLCGHFLDARGRHLAGQYSDRIIGIAPEDILAVPERICVAGGKQKKAAVLAAIRGGFVTHLVADTPLAEALA